MSLNMSGHIDQVFESIPATRIKFTGSGYVDGIYVDGVETPTPHTVTVQQASDRDIESIEKGGERIVDARRVYVNDGIDASISPSDAWVFQGQRWKCGKLDNRPWRNYCRAIVYRIDDQ